MNSPFVELGLSKELVAVLTGLGYEEPTPIQSQSIPPLLAGKDLLGQAATGKQASRQSFAKSHVHAIDNYYKAL